MPLLTNQLVLWLQAVVIRCGIISEIETVNVHGDMNQFKSAPLYCQQKFYSDRAH